MSNRNQPIERKPKLTTAQIDMCFTHMLRDPQTFEYAKQHLKPTDFNPMGETRYALLWASALSAAERSNGVLPSPGTELAIIGELSGLAEAGIASGTVTVEAQRSAENLLVWAFEFEKDKLNPDYYRSMVQDLIVERVIVNKMTQDMTLARDVGRPIDILASLNANVQRLQSVMVDRNATGITAFPKDFKPKKLGKFSTGLPFMDKFMNGGQAPKEVYAILGPTGLGKTTMGIMLTVLAAREWNKKYREGVIPRPKVSCFFSWEQDVDRLRLRFWSFAGMIDSTRLEMYADEQIQLSAAGKYQDYELKMLADTFEEERNQGRTPGAEIERLNAATVELGDTVRIFDFSGADVNPRVGEGGMDEVAATLRAVQKEGFDIGVVVLDYAGIAVRRHMASKGEDVSNMRHYLASFCNEARFKVANPFDCPVWVLQQLNPEANKKAPGAKQHHSYASECGNFAENVWFAFVFSTKDSAKNLCTLFCTKERRASGETPPVILKIEGHFCRMVDTLEWCWEDRSTGYTPTTFKDREIKSQKDIRADDKAKKKKLDGDEPGKSSMGNY